MRNGPNRNVFLRSSKYRSVLKLFGNSFSNYYLPVLMINAQHRDSDTPVIRKVGHPRIPLVFSLCYLLFFIGLALAGLQYTNKQTNAEKIVRIKKNQNNVHNRFWVKFKKIMAGCCQLQWLYSKLAFFDFLWFRVGVRSRREGADIISTWLLCHCRHSYKLFTMHVVVLWSYFYQQTRRAYITPGSCTAAKYWIGKLHNNNVQTLVFTNFELLRCSRHCYRCRSSGFSWKKTSRIL